MNYWRLGGLNNRHLFLTVLEMGNFRIIVSEDLVSGEALLGLYMATFLLYPPIVERLLMSLGLFYKVTNLIHEGGVLMT